MGSLDLPQIVNLTTKVAPFIQAYDFEVYDIVGTVALFQKYRPVVFAIIGVYLTGVYFGQKWMEHRPAYNLSTPLFFWNASLALYSIIGTIRGLPEVLYLLSLPDGTYLSVCAGLPHNYVASFWAMVFALSKIVELGDTAFIILRKQKLIVLHWFHHVATLVMFWIGYENYDPAGRFIILNTFVHSFMYSYYALKAIKVKIPRRISKALTTLQILQMFCGLYVVFSALLFAVQGRPCRRNKNMVYISVSVIASFAILFIHFFKTTYYSRHNIKSKGE
ncbi:unnamed protein product [Allacma fusca]|uniref:Elongation of very long chain fatty acids protein n=1 Tax=Allacma fusca TaxID=39272 RepID=A0A8J2KEW5_9HEXA|nr:unnamed protein product [Allacma fusca]